VSYKDITLLAITGLSPQVVTETLFAIHEGGLEWPTQIKVITTKKGKEQARLGLLVDQQLQQLCDDYNLPVPAFSSDDILVVPAADGTPVDDARTLEDQEALADFITATVAKLTSNSNRMIHASIAGGRKTMTFFLGYAMSLFARPQDRLSHVLVSADYESVSDFYYPTPEQKKIIGRDGSLLDASAAQVMLAEIPFISQRALLNDALLQDFSTLSYNEVIRAIKLAQEPQSIQVELCYDRYAPRIRVNDTVIDFSRRKLEFAFFAMCYRPRESDYDDAIERPTSELSKALVSKYFYLELANLAGITYHPQDEKQFLDELQDNEMINERTRKSLEREGGLSASSFDTRKANLYTHLQKALPKSLVDIVMPAIVRDKEGQPLVRGEKSSQGGQYGTWLKPKQIHFV